ncbi:MAG: hypothetical protein JWO38_3489 [Gemmataceae bacterium]|nr:hypothetical protein [Gemmataceae bacterium]
MFGIVSTSHPFNAGCLGGFGARGDSLAILARGLTLVIDRDQDHAHHTPRPCRFSHERSADGNRNEEIHLMRPVGMTLAAALLAAPAARAQPLPVLPTSSTPPAADPKLDAHLAAWEQRTGRASSFQTKFDLISKEAVFKRETCGPLPRPSSPPCRSAGRHVRGCWMFCRVRPSGVAVPACTANPPDFGRQDQTPSARGWEPSRLQQPLQTDPSGAVSLCSHVTRFLNFSISCPGRAGMAIIPLSLISIVATSDRCLSSPEILSPVASCSTEGR